MADLAFHLQLVNNLETAVLLLDQDLNVQYLNASAEALMQVSGRRCIGEHIENVFIDGKDQTGFIKSLTEGNPYTKREAELVLPVKQKIIVDYSVNPINVDNKASLLIEVHPRDRLIRISREEELISNQAATQSLVRGMAHEIKNPLGGIRGSAQLLARMLKDEDLKEFTDIIIDEVDRLKNLVDRMLGPNKLPERDPTNIHEVLERVYSLISVEADGAIIVQRDYDPSIPELAADKEQLIQVVLNIVRNAMQAMLGNPEQAQPATIVLRTRSVRQFTIGHTRHRLVLHISIVDNGPGIPEDIRESLFYPMISGRAEGTGLGLSIAQSIVSQHQGIIECESEPGRTQFSIFIPLIS